MKLKYQSFVEEAQYPRKIQNPCWKWWTVLRAKAQRHKVLGNVYCDKDKADEDQGASYPSEDLDNLDPAKGSRDPGSAAIKKLQS